MNRPTKDMNQKLMTREQMPALLQEDNALRALLQATLLSDPENCVHRV